MSASIRSSADGSQAIIQVNGVDKVTIGASGITAGSFAPNSIDAAAAALAFSGSNVSLASSGYQKLPSGLIIQWGNQTNASLGSGTITLPIAFSVGFSSLAATVTTGSTGNTVKANPTSLSQFTWNVLNLVGASTGAFSWIAIGF